jgi:phosphonate transport system substrate-binding protein
MRKLMLLLVVLSVLVMSFASTTQAQDQTIAEIAAGNADFATLMAAVAAADPAVATALSSEGEYTVFAPTNEAFAETLTALGVDPATVLADQALLTAILTYHVLPGIYLAADVLAAAPADVATLQGESLSVRVFGESSVVVDYASVTAADITASNGVIHVINRVLVPQSILKALIADQTLGTADDPLQLMFIPSENAEEVQAGADDLAALISAQTGLSVEAVVATDYSAAVEAMCSEEAEIGALNTFSYILAKERGCAEVGVVSVRRGSVSYQGQIVAAADSGIAELSDITSETVFCRPDPLSTSGWIIPSIAMRAAGVDVDALQVVDSGGHDGVITAVYNGECQAGASFVDARSAIADASPDVNDKVLVIGVSAPIPNDTLSFANTVPGPMRYLLVEALLDIAYNAENAALLEAVYNWTGLAPAADAFFDDFREQLDAAGVDVENLN